MKIILENTVETIDIEDGGCALIAHLSNRNDEDECGFFVRLHSWCECPSENLDITNKKHHEVFNSLKGRKIKVTIETID